MLNLFARPTLLRLLMHERMHREDGGVVIEYGLVMAVIAVGLAAVGIALVGGVGDWFSQLGAYANTLSPS